MTSNAANIEETYIFRIRFTETEESTRERVKSFTVYSNAAESFADANERAYDQLYDLYPDANVICEE